MEYIPLVLAILGVVLIVIGVFVSLADWKRKRTAPSGEVKSEKTGLPEALEGLAKVFDALKGYPLGMQLVMVGVLLEVIAAFFGGIRMAAAAAGAG